ncbi:MAG: anaerobic ribonucleoside-triphosphate reductase activating protein [Bacteroidales bacterium]|nr:anaerobic ribonucleoside-triphosphate reductase activating protein [Bacteroidales bacterium]
MKIAGFTKQSLIDFPGNISSIVFTQGCNFRCGFCHNPNLVLPEKFETVYSLPTIFDYLNKYKNLLDAVCISGGEPTIHSDLPDFISEIKNMGFKVKLDTNGTNSIMLEYLLSNKLIDFVAMDIKQVLDFDAYNVVVGNCLTNNMFNQILNSIKLIESANIGYQFRTTVVKGFHTHKDIEVLQKRFKTNYKLQQFKPDVYLDSSLELEPLLMD